MKGKDRHEFTRMGDENADFEPLICTDEDGIANADGADGGNWETCLPVGKRGRVRALQNKRHSSSAATGVLQEVHSGWCDSREKTAPTLNLAGLSQHDN